MTGLVVDLFAGGGGASEGIRLALGRNPDYALNHSPAAVAMHKANHPDTVHYCQDVWQVQPNWITRGRQVDLLWGSPDCTHFSRAKGGPPKRNGRIRDLAWVLVKWAQQARPRVIAMENVKEFQDWGPLDEKGVPIKERKGETFQQFVRKLRQLGYSVQWRTLKAHHYGAPTIRERLFLIARCDGSPIVWPEPTHGPGLLPYRSAAECIDWTLPCPSIFERKRPLAENTLRRIALGIQRFVIDTPEPFIVTYYGPKKAKDFRGQDLQEPLRTVTTENRFALVTPYLSSPSHSKTTGRSKYLWSLQDQLRTVTTSSEFALVSPYIVSVNHTAANYQHFRGQSAQEPLRTVTNRHGFALVAPRLLAEPQGDHQCQAAALLKNYTGVVGQPITRPAGTITTIDHHSLLTSNLVILRHNADGRSITAPAPTITSGGKHLAEVRAFLVKYYNSATGQPLTDPLHTSTTKPRFGLVTIHGRQYVIADIGFRMLQPKELFLAQGFGPEYIINLDFNGRPLTKEIQTKLVGNSVPPQFVAAIVKANIGTEKQAEEVAV